MKKRILSILLAVLMLLSALPLGMVDTAYAAETSGVAAQSYYVAGGQCGDDLTWTLDSSGTLTISGTGPMYNYSLWDNPWCDIALRSSGISTRVVNAVVSSGVTALGERALADCGSMVSVSLPETLLTVGESCFMSSDALRSITIPNSVRSIGLGAFTACKNLSRVTLGRGLQRIGGQAFRECSSLSSIVIPDGVKKIEYLTFSDCANLMEITIPHTVTVIENHAFANCNILSRVTFTGTRAQWNAIDMGDDNDPLLSANITFAGSGPAAPTVTAGTDSQGRPTLKWNAVTGAAKYDVYRSYSENGPYTKYSTVTGTTYTNTAYLENGTTYYYRVRALNSSGVAGAYSSVVYVTYKQTLSAPTVTGGNDSQGRPTLKWNAVSGAARYEVYRARSRSGEYIKYSTVTGTSYTNTSYIEDGNTYYYKVRALKSDGTAGAWSSIVSVTYRAASTGTLPAPTVTGGNDSQGRPTLKWDKVAGAAKYEVYRARSKDGDYIKYSTVTGTSYTNISYIENGNTYYYKVRALKSDGTAGTWSSIVSVTYRAASTGTLSAPTVTGGNDSQGRPTLKWNAVSGAAKYEVYRARSLNGDYIKYSTVTGTSYTNTSYIENGNTYYYKVRALDANGTAGAWSSIVSVTYRKPAAATVASGKCGDSASWKLDAEGTLTISGSGRMYDYEWPADRGGTTPPWLANKYRDSIRALRVEQGITYIGRCAFDSCSNLSDVTLPTSLRIIGQCAFNDCTALRSIQLPEGLTTIKEDAFNAAGLVSITFPSTLRELRNGAFMNCEKLQSLRLPEGLTTIGVWAFYCNPNISSIYIPASVTTIGEEAFIYYNNLATVRYGGSQSQWSAVSVAANAFPDGVRYVYNVN